MKKKKNNGAIDDITRNYHRGNHESIEANNFVRRHKDTIKARVYIAIDESDKRGLTCEEVLTITGLKYQSGSPRFAELKRAKLIFKKPVPNKPKKYYVRKNSSGCNAAIYVTAKHRIEYD